MLYYESSRLEAEYNLALEEVLFEARRGEDVFLLWRDRPSVVLGKFQNAFREVNPLEAHRRGIPVIRRESGGGCVYHDLGNLNYCLMTEAGWEAGYDRFLSPVVSALRKLGIPAERRGACDIVAEGKKISGSAQRRVGGRVLHHGTLLFDADLAALHRLTSRPDGEMESKGVFSRPSAVGNARKFFAGSLEAFWAAFRECVLPGASAESLSSREEARIEELLEEKYSRWGWNFGRSPEFTRSRGETRYRARRGVIEEFFWKGERVASFEGARLEIEEIEKLCQSAAASPEEAARLMESIF